MLNEPLFKSANPPRYIAIEGPIGVGKTTLMQRLSASLEYSPVPEGAEENPFLERFYDNRRHGALAAQLFFLFSGVCICAVRLGFSHVVELPKKDG